MKVKCLVYHHCSKLGEFLPGKKYELDKNDERVMKMLADFPDRFEEVVSLPKLKKGKAEDKTSEKS